MRIGGMASGIDTEQIVRDLMRVERMRVNKYLRQEQTLKWRMEAFNNVNRNMANFILNTRKDFGLTDISVNGNIRQNSANSFNWVKQATSQDENIISASARASAMNGSYTVRVDQLAEVARVTSQAPLRSQIIGLDDEVLREAVIGEDLKFIDGGSFKITSSTGKTATFSVTAGNTINDLVNQLNNAGAELGIRAAYDKDLDQLMIISRNTGEGSWIKITDDADGLAEGIFGNIIGEEQKGKDAEIYFNGSTEAVKKSTNNFNIYGIDFQLKNTSNGQEIKINVHTNIDGIFDKVKEFVTKYNELIDSISGKINEKQHKNFQPLTQEEKDAMSEKEIELWEEKAKSGLLKNDENLNRVLLSIRNDLYKDVKGVTGSFSHIADIGITTGFYKDGGKLVIDENKLRNAIGNDPDGVMDLFFKAPDTTLTGKDRMESSGLIQRIYDGLATGMKEVIRHSGPGEDAALYRSIQSNMLIDFVSKHSNISVIDRDLNQLNSRIAREEQILVGRENSYWKRFTAMEKAMSQMNQQSAWLMSQLGLSQ